jgi:hypothetical protein
MLVSAGACFFFALLLQPLHGRLDPEPIPTHQIRLSDFVTTITSVLKVEELRALSFACFAFNGLQAVFIAYFVTYLTALGYDLVSAGALFSTVIAIAIPCRILWGWIGSFYLPPRLVMSWLAFGMAVSVVLTGAFREAWPVLAIGAVSGALSATAMSWHGILLSESARLAQWVEPVRLPGVLSFGQMGAILCPRCFRYCCARNRLRSRLGSLRHSGVLAESVCCAKGRVEHGGWCEVTHACPTMAWHDRCQRRSDDHQERSCHAAGFAMQPSGLSRQRRFRCPNPATRPYCPTSETANAFGAA